ncbi:integration host factor, alpha subunit, partial [Acidithiobacillus sp. GGI-221]
MAVTKAEIVDMLFESMGLNKREAKGIVEALF